MSNKNNKLISVVMPVYNAGQFLVESIQSIQSQTYTNWELIVVDDASTDNSYEILKFIAKTDRRIKVYRNKRNKGVSATASFALSKCKGNFISRMDADDISMPERFSMQIAYLIENPETIIVGTQCEIIDVNGKTTGFKKFPYDFKSIKEMIFTTIPMQQPSVMINRSILPKNFIWYDKKFNVAEEIELMFKLFKYGKAANLPETLLKYRIHGNNISLAHPKKTFYMTLSARIKGVFKYGYKPTFKSIIISCMQTMAVTILPETWIYPVYVFIRGMKGKYVENTAKLAIASVDA